jgi:hypothetical protein
MGPSSYMRSVTDWNVVMQCIPGLKTYKTSHIPQWAIQYVFSKILGLLSCNNRWFTVLYYAGHCPVCEVHSVRSIFQELYLLLSSSDPYLHLNAWRSDHHNCYYLIGRAWCSDTFYLYLDPDKTRNVHINVILRRIHSTTVAVEKQEVLHMHILCECFWP